MRLPQGLCTAFPWLSSASGALPDGGQDIIISSDMDDIGEMIALGAGVPLVYRR
jgi:hypothetical protein